MGNFSYQSEIFDLLYKAAPIECIIARERVIFEQCKY